MDDMTLEASRRAMHQINSDAFAHMASIMKEEPRPETKRINLDWDLAWWEEEDRDEAFIEEQIRKDEEILPENWYND